LTVDSTFANVRPQHATLAPSPANRNAIASRIPRPAPVITTTLFSRVFACQPFDRRIQRGAITNIEHLDILIDALHQTG